MEIDFKYQRTGVYIMSKKIEQEIEEQIRGKVEAEIQKEIQEQIRGKIDAEIQKQIEDQIRGKK